MKLLLLAPDFEFSKDWACALAAAAPCASIVQDGEVPDSDIEGALVDSPPAGRLRLCPNLKIVFSLSAGVDSLLGDPTLPNIPIVRLASPEMAALMREYVAYQVLRLHRGFARFEKLQRDGCWVWMPSSRPANMCRVSVLGLGTIGLASAHALRALGFQVSGWSRTKKHESGIQCYTGLDGLMALLPQTDILVCLLPLTPETHGLIGADLLSRLPRGASFINASRGTCHIQEDLIRALDSGQVSHATLDVFESEPLPQEDPLWQHPRVTITPHTAAYPRPEACIAQIAVNLTQLSRGEHLTSTVDRSRGY